jgi:Kef-type K+ transport system membrane component KefB
MEQSAYIFFSLGAIFLLGLATDYLGRRTFLPRVTLLLALGIIVGDEVLGFIPTGLTDLFKLITIITLLMVGFVLGGKLDFKAIWDDGRHLLWISLGASLGTTLVVGIALTLIGVHHGIAILLGCIAAATAPAATVDTTLEWGGDTRFSRLLLMIVAIDDIWALVLFSLGLALASLMEQSLGVTASLLEAVHHIGGAVLLGSVIGLPAAYLTGRLKPGRPMLTEALGLVFICGGAAMWLDVSYLIAAITMGSVIANFARHHEYPFHEIENIEWPLMLVFFVLAGASLEIGRLWELGLAGAVYLVARTVGKVLGARLGGAISKADKDVQQWMGMALLPQAGVAIGLALLASNQFPQYGQTILVVVISTTVVFELFGPVCTRLALVKTST